MREVFARVREQWGGLDILVHSNAFANREYLEGRFIDTSREGFLTALEVSAYTLVSLAREAAPLMREAGGGSIITLSYYGAEKVVPNYNVMGVAKAALEAIVATWPGTSDRTTFASTRSARGRSRRWPRPASRGCAA